MLTFLAHALTSTSQSRMVITQEAGFSAAPSQGIAILLRSLNSTHVNYVLKQDACLRWVNEQLKDNKRKARWDRFFQLAECEASPLDREDWLTNIFNTLALFLDKLTGDKPVSLGMHS